MNISVILPIVGAMIALRFVRLNPLTWMFVWWVASYLALRYGIDPPLPSSIIGMFMGIITIALLAYLTASSESMEMAKQAVVSFIVDNRYTIPRTVVVILLPVLVAYKIYADATKPVQAPVTGRTIHPPPPREIQFQGKTINLITADNPYRILEETNPDSFRVHVEHGRRVYYENCVFCHGDNMKGDGIFAHGFDPIPADFNDPTTIAMLQESYLFWRIAKGGPGLPEESSPWSSAMPAWEQFLTEEEIWDVILFLYDFTGLRPRAREEVAE